MNNLLKDIKENWILVVFIAGLIVGWTTFSNRLDTVEVLAKENKSTLQKIEEIRVDIAVMKNDIAIIKNNIR